ncbi:MAG: diacylglycerol kinase [Bacteroidia bacterium]
MPRFDQTVQFAWNGVRKLVRTERQFRIVLVVMILVLITGFGLDAYQQHLNRYEWAIIWLAMGLVMVSEAMNSALEKALDRLHPERHSAIGDAKDMAAGATFIASTIAVIVGLYILLPHLLAL